MVTISSQNEMKVIYRGLTRETILFSSPKHWFLAHDLLLNPTKSESSYFSTRQRLDIFNLPTDDKAD